MTSLREQLAKKRAHSTSLTFPLGEAGERAKADCDAAERTLQLAQVMNNADGEKAATPRLRKAQTAYKKVSVTISFRGLTEEERDALVSAHPATAEQEERQKDLPEEQRSNIDRATFLPAALAIAALDSDMTEQDWTAELASDRWTAGEKAALFTAVVTATNEEPAPGLPKGSAAIH
jgi:hypothetical protein